MAVDEISKLLFLANKTIPKTLMPDQPPDQYTEQPEWYDFEHKIWRCVEDIRLFLKANPSYKLSEEQIGNMIKTATNFHAKRGRQSFIMLFGYKKHQPFSDKIASQIFDKNVEGHVIDALLKMQAPKYVDIVKPFTHHGVAWIRNKAKKYIEKYGITIV